MDDTYDLHSNSSSILLRPKLDAGLPNLNSLATSSIPFPQTEIHLSEAKCPTHELNIGLGHVEYKSQSEFENLGLKGIKIWALLSLFQVSVLTVEGRVRIVQLGTGIPSCLRHHSIPCFSSKRGSTMTRTCIHSSARVFTSAQLSI